MRLSAIDMLMRGPAEMMRGVVTQSETKSRYSLVSAALSIPLVRERTGSWRHILRWGERNAKIDSATYCLLGFVREVAVSNGAGGGSCLGSLTGRWLPVVVSLLAVVGGSLCIVGLANASLPDGRALEMVSPLDKNGGAVAGIDGVSEGGVVQASVDGQTITYVSFASFGAPRGAPLGSQYVARRESGVGWLTQNISTPMNDQIYELTGRGTPFRAFSPDLSGGLVFGGNRGGFHRPVESPSLAGAPVGYENYYLYGIPGGDLQPLLTHAPDVPGDEFGLTFLGGTADLGHVVVASSAALKAGEETGKSPEMYEWDRSTGGFQPVSILPDGTPVSSQTGLGGTNKGEGGQAISEDGARVVWTRVVPNVGTALYVREGIGTSSARTVQIDAPAGQGQFLTASSDGSRVFFADTHRLTADSTASGSLPGDRPSLGDLYLSEPGIGVGGRLVDLTVDHGDVGGAEVQGVLGASADGSYVYFLANGVLNSGATPGNCTGGTSPLVAVCNLYLWHEGWEKPRFVATLSGGDESGSLRAGLGVAQDWQSLVGLRTARVSRDGLSVVFMSQQPLRTANFPGGYDSTVSSGASCGLDGTGNPLPAQCEEVFLYEVAGAGRLSCVSCNPLGVRPSGPSGIPGGTKIENNLAIYQSRVLSEGGGVSRVFFDSADGLVPQDTNGAEDVYEYEGGSVYMLSDGRSVGGASFVDASLDGSDVFFITKAQLVAQDTDQQVDLYDARAPHEPREAVGFPFAPPVVCEGEDCRAASATPPAFAVPTSSVFVGAGNVGRDATKPVVRSRVKKVRSKKRPKYKAKPRRKAVFRRGGRGW